MASSKHILFGTHISDQVFNDIIFINDVKLKKYIHAENRAI